MRQCVRFTGTLPIILRNDEGVYEGDLVAYFRNIFMEASSLQNGYHNFRHLMYVLCRCYEACQYYADVLTRVERRNLLIAAMYHDVDHVGKSGPDAVNIERAVRALVQNLQPCDQSSLKEIVSLIRTTEYPYTIQSSEISLSGQIIRDADLSQAISPVWIQEVIFGFAEEWSKAPLEVLKAQVGFHNKLEFITEWAKVRFPRAEIEAKIYEAQEIHDLIVGRGVTV